MEEAATTTSMMRRDPRSGTKQQSRGRGDREGLVVGGKSREGRELRLTKEAVMA